MADCVGGMNWFFRRIAKTKQLINKESALCGNFSSFSGSNSRKGPVITGKGGYWLHILKAEAWHRTEVRVGELFRVKLRLNLAYNATTYL
jgi:hypothetical protein